MADLTGLTNRVDDFETFVREVEPRLRRGLVAARGPMDGRDAAAEALAYAWEHWAEVSVMTNPVGYLYRVGRSRTRSGRRVLVPPRGHDVQPEIDPALTEALRALPDQQRVSVFLVHGCGWSHAEVGQVLDIAPSTVATHVLRALNALRARLEVT